MRRKVLPDRDVGRGYQPVGQNVTKGRPDLHEALDLMLEASEKDASLAKLVQKHPDLLPLIRGRNHWPADEEVPGFR